MAMSIRKYIPEPVLEVRRRLIRINRLRRADAEDRIIEVEYPYNPLPRKLIEAPGGKAILEMLESRKDAIADFIRAMGRFRPQFEKISIEGDPAGNDPFWINTWLGGLDSASIYTMLATRNPAYYLEVGSGNSTKFARRAISDHGLKTKIISIDPAPRAGIDTLCDEVIRAPFETVPLERIAPYLPDSVIFVDNSHRSFQNSDVTVFFTDLLPAIPKGSIWGLHDIFLPEDYPADWKVRYYNEQYMLMAYLLGGAQTDRIVMANAYAAWDESLIRLVASDLFTGPHLDRVQKHGVAFWMERL
jgi:hypothetical protein